MYDSHTDKLYKQCSNDNSRQCKSDSKCRHLYSDYNYRNGSIRYNRQCTY